jgi:uncharacterized delta-60 repeat protein
MKVTMRIALLFISITIFIQFLSAKPGDLDSSFGENGVLVKLFDKFHWYYLESSAIQENDKIITAGNIWNNNHLLISRFSSYGTIDNSFDSDGLSDIEFQNGNPWLIHLLPINEGKTLISGTLSNQKHDSDDIFYLKLNNDGSIDKTFGSNGFYFIFDSLYWSHPNKLYQFQKSKYLSTISKNTYTPPPNFAYSIILCMNENGTIDSSFGINGMISFDMIPQFILQDLVVLRDQSILLGGNWFYNKDSSAAVILKLKQDYKIDSTFGNNGIVIYDLQSDMEGILYLRLTNDNNIIAHGFTSDGNVRGSFLIKTNEFGELDNTFNDEGYKLIKIQDDDKPSSMIIQSDDNILISGYSGFGDVKFQYIQRFNKSGLPDSSFGLNSKVMTRIDTNNTTEGFLHLRSDNKLILVGNVFMEEESGISLLCYYSGLEVGIKDPFLHESSFVWPNPFKESTNISIFKELHGLLSMRLYDINGEMVQETQKYCVFDSFPLRFEFQRDNSVRSGRYLMVISDQSHLISTFIEID